MRYLMTLAALALTCSGANDKTAPVRAGNDAVDIIASVMTERQQIKNVLGEDPGLDMIVVKVQLSPKTDAKFNWNRDMFTLISRKDGQRTAAMHPSQIAGSGVLTVASSRQGGGGAMLGQRRGPIWGGIPGTGDRPRRVGGDDDNVVGSATASESKSQVKNADGESPVLAALKAKELVFEPSAEPVSGLLYFLLEGKHKLKDLELLYTGPGGRLVLDFVK